jgi:hypothetical protein
MRIGRGPIVCLVLSLGMFCVATETLLTARPADSQAKPASDPKATPEQQDLAALSQLVDAVSAGTQPAPTDVAVTWSSHHFIKSQGDSVYVPFTISIDRRQLTAPSTALYVRVVSKQPAATPPAPGTRPSYPWDTIHFIELPADGKLSRAIALPPGTYEVFVGVKDKGAAAPAAGPAKIGLVRHDLTVPSFNGPDLAISSVILARSLEQLTAPLAPDKQQDNPYVFGTLKVVPSVDGSFAKTGELQVLFWVYGASHTAGKPDVRVEFNFHQMLPEGPKYFNKTAPQDMNATTLPPEFNLTMGHQLLSSLAIPLASFPAGNYKLEIKVTDKPSGKSLTDSVNFTVSPS